jgi:hypothetical protein
LAVKVVLVSCQHPDYDPLKYQQKDKTMSALPVYQVEFIPLERRLDDRRVASRNAALPRGITADRRKASSRRMEDLRSAKLHVI